MQMVAASKMRRAQEADKASLPYTKAAQEILTYFASQGIVKDHRWFVTRPVKRRMFILIAADKGLAGRNGKGQAAGAQQIPPDHDGADKQA